MLVRGRCDCCEGIKLTEAGMEYVRKNFMADVSKRSFARKHESDDLEGVVREWTEDLTLLICKDDIGAMLRELRLQLTRKLKQKQGKKMGGAYSG